MEGKIYQVTEKGEIMTSLSKLRKYLKGVKSGGGQKKTL